MVRPNLISYAQYNVNTVLRYSVYWFENLVAFIDVEALVTLFYYKLLKVNLVLKNT